MVKARTGREIAVAVPVFDRKEVGREPRHERDQLPGEDGAQNAGEQADQHALENEEPEHAARATPPAPCGAKSRGAGR